MLNYLPKPATPPIDLSRMAKLLKVLAEPNRLLIFHLLKEGVQCNCELGEGLQMAPNLISHHLRRGARKVYHSQISHRATKANAGIKKSN